MNPNKISTEVARLRERIAAKKDELDGLDYVKVPREEADRAIETTIASRAERGRMSVGYFADGLGLPHLNQEVSTFDQLCWFAPEFVRKRFSEELDRHYAGAVAMDAAAVSQQRSKLEGDLFDLEVQEERLIAEAENLGITIHRRGDADPRAVLEA